jgi:hypothetical protein
MRALLWTAGLAAGFCAVAVSARAQEYCVTCSAPDATYRCVVSGDSSAAHSSRAQLLCITELAQSGHHASCSAGRNPSTGCPGELRTVAFPPGTDLRAPPLAETPPAAAPPGMGAYAPPPVPATPGSPPQPAPGAPPGVTEAPPPADAEPKTVEELAKKTVESTGQGLKKAGDVVTDTGNAIGNAAKKTWKCVASLFGDC